MRIIRFLPSFDNMYYIFVAISLIIILVDSRDEKIKINLLGVLLIGICTLSILVNEIPTFFRPWQRLILWIVMVLFSGPFISNKCICYFRIRLFVYLQFAYIFIVLLSFIGKFTGLSHFQGPYFAGITGHSILFGIIAANSLISMTFIIVNNIDKIKNRYKITILILLFIINFLMILAAASRSALIASIIGILPILSVFFKNRASKGIAIMFTIIFIFLMMSPILSDYTIGIREKNHGQVTSLGFSSREEKWNECLRAFKSNPLLGVGFSTVLVDENNEIGANGQIETGSSWLGVLSMTGMLGCIAMMLLLMQVLWQLYSLYTKKNKYTWLLGGIFICYILHMCSEGYIYAGGSVLCMNFWLTMGAISAFSKIHYIDLFPQLRTL